MSTKVTLVCTKCPYKARRELMLESGSYGVSETSSEPAFCPKGHGLLVRQDGVKQERWAMWKNWALSRIKEKVLR